MRTDITLTGTVINGINIKSLKNDNNRLFISFDTQDKVCALMIDLTVEQAYQLCQCLKEKVDVV